MEELKAKARSLGLWNLFLGREYGAYGAGLTNVEYGLIGKKKPSVRDHLFPMN